MKIEGHLYQRQKNQRQKTDEWIIQLEIPVWLADRLNGKTFYVNGYSAPSDIDYPREVNETVAECGRVVDMKQWFTDYGDEGWMRNVSG